MDRELTRQTAHVLLDMLSAQQVEDERARETAAATAFERLNEIGAVNLLIDDQTGEANLDISALLYGSSTLTWLLMQLLAQGGDPIDHQVIALRSTINSLYGDQPDD